MRVCVEDGAKTARKQEVGTSSGKDQVVVKMESGGGKIARWWKENEGCGAEDAELCMLSHRDMSKPTFQLAVHRHQHGAGQADGVLGDEMQSNICWDGSSWGGLVSKLAAHHLRIPSLLWIIDQTSLESVYRNQSNELLQDSHARTRGLNPHRDHKGGGLTPALSRTNEDDTISLIFPCL